MSPRGGGEKAAKRGGAPPAVGPTEPPAEGAGETLEITMPEMGESVAEGTVLEWHVAEGDPVDEGQTVVEISTDKVDAEVPAPASGTVTKILVQPDETIEVGKPLAEMVKGAAGPDSGADSASS